MIKRKPKKTPRRSKAKKRIAPKQSADRSQAIAITLTGSAAFIFLTFFFENSTGIIGDYLVINGFGHFFGLTAKYSPIFLILAAYSLLTSEKKQRSLNMTTLIVAFMALAAAIELKENGISPNLAWPIPENGGGIIGYFLLYCLHFLLGPLGSRIAIATALGAGIILSLNISLNKWLKRLYKHLFTVKLSIEIDTNPEEEDSPPPAKPKKEKKTPTITPPKPVKKDSLKEVKKNLPKDEALPTPPPIPDPAPAKTTEAEAPAFSEESLPNITLPSYENKPRESSPSQCDTSNYVYPPLSLLSKPSNLGKNAKEREGHHQENAKILEDTLESFNVDAKVINITPGPTVTRYELKPGVGVKISKITNLSNDIALKLAAANVRIEAPIPGKSLIGIEIPNPKTETITMRNIIETDAFQGDTSHLLTAIGVTISGKPIAMDLAKMPHVLVAGATGSGKSVCLNAIIVSILLNATPDEVKFLMIDPKKVELSLYDNIPHLLAPVVTNPHKAAATLKRWALAEMENRYELFSRVGVKNIAGFNDKIQELIDLGETDEDAAKKQLDDFLFPDQDDDVESLHFEPKKLPYIVVIIDELADLMMVASQDVESTICRLAQMSRATGIHLVIATQRPSVNVITGLIKANIPSRISFYLQSQIDSRTVLDVGGAEKLLGKGDMLYSPVGSFKPQRIQGIFVSEKEIKAVVNFVKKQAKPQYLDALIDIEPLSEEKGKGSSDDSEDELFEEAKTLIMNTQYASTSYLQRKLRIGYNRAARLMDELKEKGIIAEYATQSKPKT